ncbi:MAG: acylphosphatase [Lachnospiraceae bacterium]|nr:acylphosphatase [Lachnospiraceae bacterium]
MRENYIRKHLIFHGRVQGVGFRYHAEYAAQNLGASGWVRNLYDGTVECEIQGTKDMINDFITMLYNGRYIVIDAIEQKEIPVQEERCFKIRY